MPLASIVNVPSTPAEIMNWAFSHSDSHRQIEKAIFLTYGIVIPPYILDPMPTDFNSDDMQSWIQLHQAAHSDFESILGIAGVDLSQVDYTKQDQVQSWSQLHFQSHYQAQLTTNYPD